MRIISGKYKGRILSEPHGHKTHPMSEKMRGAIFNALGDIEGLDVLDAYAGTGAVGIEALSRGARKVVAVEVDFDAFTVLKKNAESIQDKNLEIHRANIASYLENISDASYDIVILDPPYDAIVSTQIYKCINVLKKSGILVFSMPEIADFKFDNLETLKERSYAGGKLVFYKKLI